jgi:hypothetical protein
MSIERFVALNEVTRNTFAHANQCVCDHALIVGIDAGFNERCNEFGNRLLYIAGNDCEFFVTAGAPTKEQ